MQKKINILTGQSNFDVCLQTTGGFDGFIKFLSDNEIENSSITKNSEYSFNTNDTKNSSFTGYSYSTKNPSICGLITGLNSISIQSNSLDFSWNTITGIFGYEWFITTTNVAPSGSGNTVFTNSVTVSGLSSNTTYYFWIRTVCSVGFVSGFVSLSETTLFVPIPPVLTGLVLHLNSQIGVQLDGLNGLINWADRSGNGNDEIYDTGNKALFVPSVPDFSGKPGLYFNNSFYKTLGNFVGLNGIDKCTVYVVLSCPTPTSDGIILEYSTAGTTSETDGFRQYLSVIAGSPNYSTQLKGNVGLNTSNQINYNQAIHAAFIKKSAVSTNEIIQEEYISSSGLLVNNSTGSDNNNNFGNHPLVVGASQPFGFVGFTGTIGCILIYNDVLAGSDKTNTETWLRTQFNII